MEFPEIFIRPPRVTAFVSKQAPRLPRFQKLMATIDIYSDFLIMMLLLRRTLAAFRLPLMDFARRWCVKL